VRRDARSGNASHFRTLRCDLEATPAFLHTIRARISSAAAVAEVVAGALPTQGPPVEDSSCPSPLRFRLPTGEDVNVDEASAQLKAGKDISTAVVVSMAVGLRTIGMRTTQATRNAGDLALESESVCMVDEVENLETGDLDAVQVCLKEDGFPRGFLARALLHDALRHVSCAQGLAIPRMLSDELVREMISNMSQLHIVKLSKGHAAQLHEVAKAGAGEATKAFKAAISALISII